MSNVILRLTDRQLACGGPTADAPLAVALPGSAWRCGAAELTAAFEALRPSTRLVRRATLELPLSWCLVQAVTAAQRRPPASLLRYALEEYIPADIDDYHCAFSKVDGSRYIGLALARSKLEQVVQAARAAGWRIDVVRVAVPHAHDPQGFLLACDVDHWMCAKFTAGRLQDLRVLRFAEHTPLPARAARLRESLPLDSSIIEQVDAEANPPLVEIVAALRTQQITVVPHSQGNARWTYFELANGDPLIGEGVGQRARQQRRLLLTSLSSLALIALGLILGLRRLDDARTELNQWERRLYADTFPGTAVPRAIALRIQAARKAVDDEQAFASASTEPGVAPLAALYEFLEHVPATLRLRLEEIRIDERSLVVRGQTRAHADAERLAQALDAAPQIRCPAPRSDRLREGGVRFSLIGRLDVAAAPEGG